MNNGKDNNVGVAPLGDSQTKNNYKVNYFFAKNSKININEILKKSFLLSLNAERKNM